MNTFEQAEEAAANLVLIKAQRYANSYAKPGDKEAAVIAIMRIALALAGGAAFLKSAEEQ